MKIKMKKNSHIDWKQMVEIMIKNSGNKISSQSFSVYRQKQPKRKFIMKVSCLEECSY